MPDSVRKVYSPVRIGGSKMATAARRSLRAAASSAGRPPYEMPTTWTGGSNASTTASTSSTSRARLYVPPSWESPRPRRSMRATRRDSASTLPSRMQERESTAVPCTSSRLGPAPETV